MPGVDHSAVAASLQANVHMILRHRLASATRALLLAAVGFLVASPFLTWRGVGTGEAYNYSLAVADGVTQLRAGVFPVLVGQTPFAFNGRVHPLRNAPYMIYLAGAIDLVTGHRLGFPALQNLSLVFSLLASFFGAYAALRWGVRAPPWPAVFLACVYGCSTALLGAAYTLDLYMTVHAAPFAPLVLAAVARQAVAPSARNDFLLAAFLAAAWWAHPPVALWLTVTAGLLRLVLWSARPSWRGAAQLAGAFGFGLLLAGFTFVSAFEITRYASFFNAGNREGAGFVATVLSEVRRSFIGSVSPVSRSAGRLGDFQLGYVAWLLLGLVLLAVRQPGPWRGRRLGATGLAGAALLMVALCVPVPYFTKLAWRSLPGVFYQLTNDWPMQRLYLIAVAAVVLASGLVLAPRARTAWRHRPILLNVLLAAAVGWLGWQTYPFVIRGFHDRWSAETTARNYLPSNLNITATSYAFLGAPPTYLNGVMEPWLEFRVLGRYGRDSVGGNYASALAASVVADHGTFASPGKIEPTIASYQPSITLEPGRHYLLDFKWRTAPFPGLIGLLGPTLQRFYILPAAGGARAFGMGTDQRTSLALSTSQAKPEQVRLEVLNPEGNPQHAPPPVLADFRLLAVDDARLPVRVQSWLPLRADVTAPADNCYVETPRRFIPGYVAIVNGRTMRAIASPTGDVMVPVPAGDSRIELRYEGTPLLRAAFWISLSSWLAGALAGGLLVLAARDEAAKRLVAAPARAPLRSLGWILAGAVVGAAAIFGALERNRLIDRGAAPGTVGPLEVRLLLPKGQGGRQEPIVVSGKPGAGNFVFLAYTDEGHIRIGVDIWGYLHLSDPVSVDYDQEQDLVVSGGMLYPPGDPAVRALSPFMQNRLRGELRVELNGRTVLVETRPTFESKPDQITIGVTKIGGSMVERRFTGKILQVARLPMPLAVVRSNRPLRLQLILPANSEGLTEPLLTAETAPGTHELFYITYLAGNRIVLGHDAIVGVRTEGPAQRAEPGRIHTLDFLTRGKDLALVFDGRDALLLPGKALAPGHVEMARLGFDAEDSGITGARFTGAMLAPVSSASTQPSPSGAPDGPFRLVAMLPSGKTGAAEPLVVTGKAGKGDLVFIKYTDPRHVQFGYDHWGVGGGSSEPIAIDYSQPHEIEIGLGSLYAERKDASWMGLPADVRERLRNQVTVRLDGVPVWQTNSPAYPSEPSDIRVGQNLIGASSCGERFTGEILEIGRARP